MAIQEQILVEIATVEVNDEYRIELKQVRKVVDYSPEQAERLANELLTASARASKLLTDDMDERFERMRAETPRTVTGEVVL